MSKSKKAAVAVAIVLLALIAFYLLFLVVWQYFSDLKGPGRTDGVLDSSKG